MKKIDSVFIEKWEKKYSEADEKKYIKILNLVKNELENITGISLSTFKELYTWKTRGRSYNNIIEKEYETIYNENIKISIDLPDDKKIYILDGMPGVRIAVASTILHFIYPNQFPIIDVNTIKALKELGYYEPNEKIEKLRDSPESYNNYRRKLLKIQKSIDGDWTLHQIDKAIFSFGKYFKI